MSSSMDLITAVLIAPESATELSDIEWDLLIRQGRRTKLLARLAHTIRNLELLEQVPIAPRLHLQAALKAAIRQDISLRWEVACICKELSDAGAKVTLLKGAAYAMAEMVAADGRVFNDIDIIVPKARIEFVESDLMLNGWQAGHHDEYDQRYYRQWMHEIPPLRHVARGTTIDVHHAILPETARIKVNTAALLAAVVPIKGYTNLYVLQPADMLLHSATHLFHEGDFDKGLRDLFDLDSLFRAFGEYSENWQTLVPRATELGLTRPLYYAIRYSVQILTTPVPLHIIEAAQVGRPHSVVLRLMDLCYLRALRPLHVSTKSLGNWIARFALYVRSHWIRMPFHLLVYHLGRKAFIRPKVPEPENPLDGLAEKA